MIEISNLSHQSIVTNMSRDPNQNETAIPHFWIAQEFVENFCAIFKQ